MKKLFYIPQKPLASAAVRLATALGLLASLPACKKFLQIPLPPDNVVSTAVFADEQTAKAAVAGLYSQMVRSRLLLANGGLTLFPALTADELYNTAPDAAIDPFTLNAIPANDEETLLGRLWEPAYTAIYHANAVLEGLDRATAISAAGKQQLQGEALLLRAFHYFCLVNLFGDVPLVTTTDYRQNAARPRTATAEVYSQITTDLKKAQDLLSEAYPSAERVRPNKWAATALLARVYLYRQQWQEAEAAATAVLQSGVYGLETDLDKVFLAGSKEAIWQLRPANSSYNTAEGNALVPSSPTQRPAYAVQASLLDAFEPGDNRKSAWLAKNTIAGVDYYYPFKYKVRSGTVLTEYNTVLRLAELYLIRAEARAQQEKIPEAQADLNAIRTRAGLPPTTAADKSSVLTAIEQERRIELLVEWGHRWFDLKRTGRITAVLSAVKPAWKPTAALYPIPFSEIRRNPALTQNPGY